MTRRQFAQSVAAALGAAAVSKADGPCLLPPPHYLKKTTLNFSSLTGSAKEWRKLPALERLDRPLLSSWQDKPEKTRELADAYRKLAAIEGKTGLLSQANMHGYMCNQMGVHDSWAFLLWHRGFLYFHERILAKLTRKDFRLPAWDWDTSRAVPKPWANSDIGSLIVQACPRKQELDSEVDPCRLQAWLFSNKFEDFVGGKGIAGTAFAGVHNDVHSQLGGAMGDPGTAASDPLFYAHHVNVDRYWWHWHTQLGQKPDDKRFFDQKFYFYDDHGDPVSVCAELLMDPALLGYRYDNDPPAVSLKNLYLTSIDGFVSKNLRSALFSTAISWLKSKDDATEALAGMGRVAGALRDSASGLVERMIMRRPDYSALVDLLEAKATPFPVRISAKARPGTISAGKYYSVALRTKNDDDVPFAGFGIFGHDSSHSGEIMATGCITPKVLGLLLTDLDLRVVYGPADASGKFVQKSEAFDAVSWDLFNSK